MKLNWHKISETDTIVFFEACGLLVSGALLVYTDTMDLIVATAWRQENNSIVWRSMETGNIIKDPSMWAYLAIPYVQ